MADKKFKKLENPFVCLGYEGPDYFCDRIEETEKMVSYLKFTYTPATINHDKLRLCPLQ